MSIVGLTYTSANNNVVKSLSCYFEKLSNHVEMQECGENLQTAIVLSHLYYRPKNLHTGKGEPTCGASHAESGHDSVKKNLDSNAVFNH